MAIQAMIRKFLGSVRWTRALDLAAAHRNTEALKMLDKACIELGREGIEQALLRGHLQLALGRYEECIATMQKAEEQVESSPSLDAETRAYLASYAKWRVMSAERLMGGESDPAALDYSAVPLAAVPGHLKRKFPLRDHPSWS